MTSDIVVERTGRTLVVEIARPEVRNALTREVVRTLRDVFESAADDPEVRCVLFGGRGGHFCAGADLRKDVFENPSIMDQLEAVMDEYHGVIHAIVRCPKPFVARMEGAAVGFGADLALACDLRIATGTAYLQEKFTRVGLMPDGGGTFWLPRLVGTARAMRMILLAEKVEARTLAELGVVMDVVPEADIAARAMAVMRELEKGAPLAYASAKQAVLANLGDIEGALRREREGQLRLLRSSDFMEGILAWSQKRDHNFTGQ